MNSQQENLLLEIKDRRFATYFWRMICLAWLVFSVFTFGENPGFFGFMGILAIVIIPMFRYQKYILTEEGFELHHISFIAFFTKIESYPYGEIEEIAVAEGAKTKGGFDLLFFLIDFFTSWFLTTDKWNDRPLIVFKGGNEIELPRLRKTTKNKLFMRLLEDGINEAQKLKSEL